MPYFWRVGAGAWRTRGYMCRQRSKFDGRVRVMKVVSIIDVMEWNRGGSQDVKIIWMCLAHRLCGIEAINKT